MNPKNIFTPLSMSEFLLTTETVPAYVASLNGVLPEASTAVEISGGNLNYAFRVSEADARLCQGARFRGQAVQRADDH